jgi:hypothetical protein
MKVKENKLFLLSNNAMISRKQFFKKYLQYFEKEFSENDFNEIKKVFTINMCYNASFVLAQELDNKLADK